MVPESSHVGGGSAYEDQLSELARSRISNASFSTVRLHELTVMELLGMGSQACVFKALWTRQLRCSTSEIVVAIKELHASRTLDRETLIMTKEHPNILRCLDCTIEPPYLIVSEFCAGKSLAHYLYSSGERGGLCLSTKQRTKALLDVASGMAFLHEQNIMHRDLKSTNVLLTRIVRTEEEEVNAKVADFGLARQANTTEAMTMQVGSWRWMAPELFESDYTYDSKVDVYSFGMLTYETLTGRLPFGVEFPDVSEDDTRIAIYVCEGNRPSIDQVMPDAQPAMKELMCLCWAQDAENRPEFSESAAWLQRSMEELG